MQDQCMNSCLSGPCCRASMPRMPLGRWPRSPHLCASANLPVKRSSRGGAALLVCICLDESRCALRLVGPVSLPARKPRGHGPMAAHVKYRLASMGNGHDAKRKDNRCVFMMMLTRQPAAIVGHRGCKQAHGEAGRSSGHAVSARWE